MKSSTTLVTFGCAAAVALALVGAAYAVDVPAGEKSDLIQKGDLIAPTVSVSPDTLTVEEVNLDAGISNLIRIDTQPSAAL
ncbi:hypothetical protein [Chthonobacter albigriseus]|uniref:hypothetical protein n=1 Tax=Chthonobacter albigriseus TaxID=1683161 RepID=UPI0015EF0055|nr:hypothetical protein [Chthonobacter albigriseus]